MPETKTDSVQAKPEKPQKACYAKQRKANVKRIDDQSLCLNMVLMMLGLPLQAAVSSDAMGASTTYEYLDADSYWYRCLKRRRLKENTAYAIASACGDNWARQQIKPD